MSVSSNDIRLRGRTIVVPSTEVHGRTIVALGRWLKIASVKDQEWVEGEPLVSPEGFIADLQLSGLGADIFTFSQTLDAGKPRFRFKFEMDNAAVVTTSDFNAWWGGLPQEARKNVRRAAKKGIVVRTAAFDDEFVKGIKQIYDESPVRQGRPFWHYGKDLETVKLENGTYLERSEFIGAYYNNELIGFMKWVYVDDVARIMQILSLSSHHNQRPMNALIAKAVEICHEKRKRHLVYGRFTYGNKVDSTMAEFKRRMGFEQVNFPRYYVALTLKGRLALSLGIHRGLIGVLPQWVIAPLLALRSHWFGRRAKPEEDKRYRTDGSRQVGDGHVAESPANTYETHKS